MDIYDILNSWNIRINNDENYMNCLLNTSKTFFTDRFPYPINNCDKANQLLFSYMDVVENKCPRSDFLNVEMRYRNIFNKLWAYNKTFAEYIPSQSHSSHSDISKLLDPEYKKFMYLLENSNNADTMVEINNKYELEFLVQVVLRNDVDITFYFEDYEVLVFPPPAIDVQGFTLYLNNKTYLTSVKNMFLSENIYFLEN